MYLGWTGSHPSSCSHLRSASWCVDQTEEVTTWSLLHKAPSCERYPLSLSRSDLPKSPSSPGCHLCQEKWWIWCCSSSSELSSHAELSQSNAEYLGRTSYSSTLNKRLALDWPHRLPSWWIWSALSHQWYDSRVCCLSLARVAHHTRESLPFCKALHQSHQCHLSEFYFGCIAGLTFSFVSWKPLISS